ncbi:DUF1775 domain-containing protein [Geodermatophilus sp. CPCC 205506]|uniref:DUF1775 domain-containing protein n=1 Tax=Geodermatophilus sp. CPCC 205506 TaxID=2936596 RepID=UPI003EE9C0FE
MTTRLRRAALAVLAAVVAVLTLGVGTACAHVTVSSPDAAGGFGEITFRVPSESDTARTTSLRVQLPTDTPFAFVMVEPVPGWTATITTAVPATPIEARGGPGGLRAARGVVPTAPHDDADDERECHHGGEREPVAPPAPVPRVVGGVVLRAALDGRRGRGSAIRRLGHAADGAPPPFAGGSIRARHLQAEFALPRGLRRP